MFGVWFFAACVWLCAMLFFGIGFWALRRKTPMHFWSGSTVSDKEIGDIPKYNRANAAMWMIFAAGMALIGFAGFWSMALGGVLVMTYVLGGIPVLIAVYQGIYNKYKRNRD